MQYIYDGITSIKTLLNYQNAQQQFKNNIPSIYDIAKLTQQKKIILLRQTLQKISTYPKHIQGKIQMAFTNLCKIQKLKSIAFTIDLPVQHSSIDQQKLISFRLQYTLQSGQIKYPIKMWITFTQDFLTTLPKLYVQNPSFTSTKPDTKQKIIVNTKPNPKFVQIVKHQDNKQKTKYNFKAVTGGIQIILSQINQNEKGDVKKLFEKSIQLMKSQLPFVKMKNQRIIVNKQLNRDQMTQNLYIKSKQLTSVLKSCFRKKSQNIVQLEVTKQNARQGTLDQFQKAQTQLGVQQLPPIIYNIQHLDIIKKSINAEIRQLTDKKNNLEINIKLMEQESFKIQTTQNYQQYYPALLANSPIQLTLFNLLVDHQSTKDCIVQLQNLISTKKQPQKYIQNTQFTQALKTQQIYNQKIFYQRYKLNLIMKQIVEKQKK